MNQQPCYSKVPIKDLLANMRQQANPDSNVIREREKQQPYSLPMATKRSSS
jgi:hypothetical protein